MDKQNSRPDRDAAEDLTHAGLLDFLHYDAETGKFFRRRDGKPMGVNPDRYGRVRIWIKGRIYLAHRLAWFYVHGEWPPTILDHKSRLAGENRIANLRLASRGQNAINSTKSWSASGVRGVYQQKGTKRWRVKIARVNVGYFETKEDAVAAYRAKARELYGEFAC